MSELSNCLKKEIELSNFTIYSLAKEIGYDRATLNKQLNGYRKFPKDIFLKILNLINITEPTKKHLITLFHKEIYGEYFNIFEAIKESFIVYNQTINLINNSVLSVTKQPISKNTTSSYIRGKLAIIDSIKTIVLQDLENSTPYIYFNLDILTIDLLVFFESIYINRSQNLDMKSVINFTIDNRGKVDNFSRFINILPLLLNDYCPYYCYTDGNIDSEISLLYPYYLITNGTVLLISLDFSEAIILKDTEVVSRYKASFLSILGKCKKINHEIYPFYSIPNLFNNCIDENSNRNKLSCLNEGFCSLPFMTKKHLLYMFGDKINNIEQIIDQLIDCYKKTSDFIAFVPIESIQDFIETGTDGHTSNDYSKPLPMKYRIEILQEIYSYIKKGGNYFFVRKNEFFASSLTFNLMPNSKIVFFNTLTNTDKKTMNVIKTPASLSPELEFFFDALSKSCYVIPREDSLNAIQDGIDYAKNKL